MSIGVNSQITNINNIQPKAQVAFRAQTAPVKDYPSDTVEIQGKKKGLSKGAKWGIGLGLTALVGLGACLISRGRVGTKSAKQIAEHIDFKEAKTLEEAKKFAQENFGAKMELDNLEIANFINEGITECVNKTKGKTVLPEVIRYSPDNRIVDMSWLGSKKHLYAGKKVWTFRVNDAKKQNLSLKDYIKSIKKNESIFGTIFHELGHGNHYQACKETGKLDMYFDETLKFTKEFHEDIKNNKIIKDFFKPYAEGDGYIYGFKDYKEYIAEVWRCKIEGREIPAEVERIYKKYGGRVL